MQVSSTNSTSSIPVSSAGIQTNTTASRVVAPVVEKVDSKKLKKEFEGLMPRIVKIVNSFSKFKGEVPSIIINALGTGLIAPIFIKYNFLSKTDEDTRTYSAFRQPISAVLAVITQAGMLIPINKVLKGMHNKGEFTDSSEYRYNTDAFPDVEHIQNELKKTNPNTPKDELKKLAEEQYKRNVDKLVQHAIKTNSIPAKKLTGAGETEAISPEETHGVLKQVADEMLNGKNGINETLTRYQTEKPFYQIRRGEFLRENHEQVNKFLEDVLSDIQSNKSHNDIKKKINERIKQSEKAKDDEEFIKILKELKDQDNIQALKDKVYHVKAKCGAFSKCENIVDVTKIVHERIEVKANPLRKQKAVLERISQAIDEKKTIADIHDIAKDLHENKFVRDVIEKHIKNINSHGKGLNQITGLIISLAILPVTCTLLNYLYPRIMDVAFPNLSKKKQPKSDDYFVKVNGTIPLMNPEDSKRGGKL